MAKLNRVHGYEISDKFWNKIKPLIPSPKPSPKPKKKAGIGSKCLKKAMVWMLCTSVPVCLWKTLILNAPILDTIKKMIQDAGIEVVEGTHH